ncbi:hypothetical protein [Blastococcus sp. SYSU D00695]
MWLWIAVGLVAWVLLAALVAVVLGRGIRLADQRSPEVGADATHVRPAPAARRRVIPLPPVGIVLAATAVALEAVGLVLRLTGATGPTARALSMDAPFSAPRLLVAAVFAVAAVAALAGSARIPGRRAWWAGVGLVAAVIAAVKTGSTVHATAMRELAAAIGEAQAVVLSAAAAAAVVGVLAFVSRAERRDRRRVLLALVAYAGAAVGLSAVSAVVPEQFAATATFLEESGEALAAVTFLVAVLVGVAPRLVLPASWALRRDADALTVEVARDPAADPRRT